MSQTDCEVIKGVTDVCVQSNAIFVGGFFDAVYFLKYTQKPVDTCLNLRDTI